MLVCMRTSINLPEALLAAAKAKAAGEGKTLTSLIEEGLRTVLSDSGDFSPALKPLPAFGDPDGKFLVDLTDRDALWRVLDDQERS